VTYALEVSHLSKAYGDFALDGITFALEKGYVMGFIGPNGAGKTTTIKAIMNLVRRDSGTIRVFGLDNLKQEMEVKEKIGFVYDESSYYGILTISQMAGLVSRFYRGWDEALFQRYLKDFDVDPSKKIDNLSRGMKTKFSLAVALSHGAALILMDEPTSGLDPVFRSELLDILYAVIQEGRTSIFFSTHVTADLERIADYVTFIHRGRLVFSKSKDDVLDIYALVKGGRELLNPETRKMFIGLRETASGFEALTDDSGAVARQFRDKVLIEKASLDDIMVHSVRGNAGAASHL
jgi:ABC-2 type transport system ATP-binding protein